MMLSENVRGFGAVLGNLQPAHAPGARLQTALCQWHLHDTLRFAKEHPDAVMPAQIEAT